jgi:hypothetical protein
MNQTLDRIQPTWMRGPAAARTLGVSLRTIQRMAERDQVERRQTGRETRYLVSGSDFGTHESDRCPASEHGMRKAVQLRIFLAVQSCLDDGAIASFSSLHADKVDSAFNLIQTMLVDGIIDRKYLQTQCDFITTRRPDLQPAILQFIATV